MLIISSRVAVRCGAARKKSLDRILAELTNPAPAVRSDALSRFFALFQNWWRVRDEAEDALASWELGGWPERDPAWWSQAALKVTPEP